MFLFFFLVLTQAFLQASMAQEERLVWLDRFYGDRLDLSKWNIEVNTNGGGNNELQAYTSSEKNIRVKNGLLIIEACRENVNGRSYTSGRITSKHKGDWKYGRVRVRAKVPAGAGVWPAIWMLPTDNIYGTWAASGEIDIMELKGEEPGTVYGTLHYGGEWPHQKHSGDSFSLRSGSFWDDFHIFEVRWREGRIEWWIDGVHYQTQTNWITSGGEFPAPFDQRFHLILNVAVGGNFVESPMNTQFPRQMLVDYVEVYSA